MANQEILLNDIHKALGMNQRELAQFLGMSLRTAQRIDAGDSVLSASHFAQIARAIYPSDPALAAKIAQRTGQTLEALGIVAAAARGPHPRISESVVCAAADVMELTPSAVRPALLAAFRRAGELGLSVEMIIHALEDAEQHKPPKG